MKIVFVVDKCFNIYRQRTFYNLVSLMGDCHDLQYIKPQKNLYKKLRELEPDILYMLIGGSEFSEIIELFRDKAVTVSDTCLGTDININDEPEQVFPALVEALENGKDLSTVKGITYKHRTGKADKWNINRAASNDCFLTFSTRSCKGKCSFCSIHDYQGSLRLRDISVVLDEIIGFGKYDSFQGDFCFTDPSFDSNPPERIKEILKSLIQEFPVYTYQANFRPDFHKIADAEMMGLLFDSGLTRVFVGVESGNEEDLKLYNKGTTIEDARKTVDLFKEIDCAVDIGFIMINPFSDFNKMRQNVDFLKRNHLATFDALTRPLTIGRSDPMKQITKDAGLLDEGKITYKFQDEKMLMFVTTIQLIERELHQNALAQYRNLSLKDVKTVKRQALFRQGEEKFYKMDEYDRQLTAIIHRESGRLCQWFLNLLDLIEQGKPGVEYFTMTYDYLTTEHIKSVVKEYNGLLKEMRKEYGEVAFMKRI